MIVQNARISAGSFNHRVFVNVPKAVTFLAIHNAQSILPVAANSFPCTFYPSFFFQVTVLGLEFGDEFSYFPSQNSMF